MSLGPFSKPRPKYDAHHLPILTHLIVYIPYIHDLSFAPRFEGYGGSPAGRRRLAGMGGCQQLSARNACSSGAFPGERTLTQTYRRKMGRSSRWQTYKKMILGASVRKASAVCRTCVGLAGDENRREMQNRRHFLVFVLQKCQQSQGSGGSSSRNPDLSSLLDSPRVFASQKCQQSQGSGGSSSRNPELSSLLDSPRVFASTCQQSRGSGGSSSRNPKLSSLLDSFRVVASQKCQLSQGSGGSWSRNPELSSLLDSFRFVARQKCQLSQGSGGSSSRNPELSSLLDSPRVFASQKCRLSQGSGGSWSRNPELSSLLD